VSSADQLTIETPEQVALELPLAGVGSRFLAIAIDTLLQAALGFVVAFVLISAGPALFGNVLGAAGSYLPAIGLILIFAIYWAYFAAFEIVWRGQTPGKRLAGLRVIRDSGRPLDATAAILRNLLRAVDILPGFYAVGVIVMLLNRQSRRLGDFAAGTIVVHDREPERLRTDWTGPRPDVRLTPAELVLIETYIDRRVELDWFVRKQTAERIVARISARTGVVLDAGESVDDLLDALARQARDTPIAR
jgi:uncharacterized RDD family membrane protein YckC